MTSRKLEVLFWTTKMTWIVLFALIFSMPQGTEPALQRFSVRPSSVSVREGSDVVLRCVVENQQGRVQWTKDGFALGFNRHVPGYPRYTYLGEGRLGEHHLKISAITLTEDGEYQCQVGPTATSRPIWASANVTVLVSPASVRIIGYANGAVLEVLSGLSTTLECLANEARPPATLSWSRDGEVLVKGDVDDRIEPGLVDRRWDATSRLSITPQPEDDGRRFFCQAAHPSLEAPLLAFVTLSVLYPPTKPTITGYTPGDALTEGDRLLLTCRAPRAKPTPWIVWYRESRVLDDTSTTSERGGVVNVLEVKVTAAEDGVMFTCEVNSDLLEEPLTANVTVTVHYPPTLVRIRGPSQIEDGAPLTLNCETDESKPPAVISWIVQGKVVNSAETVVSRVSTGGWITSSDLTRYVLRSNRAREVTVECQATNPSTHMTVADTKVILVTQPASPPVLQTDLRTPVLAGGILPITCTSEGGHPPPNMRIFKGEVHVPTDVTQDGNLTRAEATAEVTPADNGALIICELIRAGKRSPLLVSEKITVHFAPWEVQGKSTPSPVPEGTDVRLSCTTSSSVPPSTVTWRSEGVPLDGAVTITTHGVYGGTVTRSDLRLRVKASDNGRMVECEAGNGVGEPVSTAITLDVLHRPRWIVRPPPRVSVKEGHDLVLKAAAAANPGPPRYWWRRGDVSLETSAGELSLGRVLREHTGNYSVSAYSSRGSVNATFLIDVLYGPENLQVTEVTRVGEGEEVRLTCSAEGNPKPGLTWSPQHSGGRTLSHGVGVSVLKIEKAAHSDTGVYYCQAESELAALPAVGAKVIVSQAAKIISSQDRSSRAHVGERGRLECHARAAPPPTFLWSTQSGIVIGNSSKYIVHEPKLEDDLDHWKSVLEVLDVTLEDYSVYRCAAKNDLGRDVVVLALNRPARPNAPRNFSVENVTETSIKLAWVPDYQEGAPSSFIVEYKAQGTRDFQILEINESDVTGATLNDLSSFTEYVVVLKAKNDFGVSDQVVLDVVTKGEGQLRGPATRKTRMVFVLMTICGLVLLVLNVIIIACILRKRKRKRKKEAALAASRPKSRSIEVVGSAKETTCDETGGFVPVKSRTPSAVAQCQNNCPKDSEVCEHTKLMIQLPATSTRSLNHLPPTPPQNGGVPKRSPNRDRRARSQDLLQGPGHRHFHTHSHTHKCLHHSPQDKRRPLNVPTNPEGQEFSGGHQGRRFVWRESPEKSQGRDFLRGYHGRPSEAFQGHKKAARYQGYGIDTYQGRHRAQGRTQVGYRGYEKPQEYQGHSLNTFQGHQKLLEFPEHAPDLYQEQESPQKYQAPPPTTYQAPYHSHQDEYHAYLAQCQDPLEESIQLQGQHEGRFQGQGHLTHHQNTSQEQGRGRATQSTVLRQEMPNTYLLGLESSGVEGYETSFLRDLSYQLQSKAGDPATSPTQDTRPSSFLETLQRPPEAFADPATSSFGIFQPRGPRPPPPPVPPKTYFRPYQMDQRPLESQSFDVLQQRRRPSPPTPRTSMRPPPSPKLRAQHRAPPPSPTRAQDRKPSLRTSRRHQGSSPPPPPPPPPLPSLQRRARFPDDFLWHKGVARGAVEDGKDSHEVGEGAVQRT